MGENKWSPEQQQVIDSRRDNLLVSAAAGAGKTAVLVEHIMGLITDGGTDIDRLLIMTFTNAAAGEMRDRIARYLSDRSEKEPENERLRRQQMLVHNASIMTIDSFCLSVVHEFFHIVDLDPSFRIGQEAEIRLIEADTIDELFEELYEKSDETFTMLVECFGNSKSDEGLVKTVFRIASAAMSHPDPEGWLRELGESSGRDAAARDISLLISEAGVAADHAILKTKELIRFSETHEGLDRVISVLQSDIAAYRTASELTHGGVDDLNSYIRNFSLNRITLKGEYDKEAYEKLKAERGAVKREFLKAASNMTMDTGEILKEYDVTGALTKGLTDLTIEYLHRLSAAKKEKNIVDFNDLEHYTLEILTSRSGDGGSPADELRRRYDKIFVDEYQDSNMIQECITTAIADGSPGSPGSPLTFMVGDVKQSIYRFRMAKPELFIGRMKAYGEDSSKGLCISLHKNYRSRPEVLESTNDVFYSSMKECIGGITYDEECALNPGRETGGDEEGEHKTELIIVDKEKAFDGWGETSGVNLTGDCTGDEENPDEGDDTEQPLGELTEMEARAVAGRIKKLIRDGLEIPDGDHKRPVTYGDIAVLLRTTKGNADVFRTVFEEEGIPSFCSTKAGFFETFEIGTVLDYLRIIDNPRQDIPFTAVLHSPVCGLTADQLAVIRVTAPSEIPMCEAARSYDADDEIGEKLRRFFEAYDEIAGMNRTRDIDRLLGKLYDITGFYTYCTAMSGGARRASNLDLLTDYASDYEKSSFSGLFSFVRYVEQLKEKEMDLAEASSSGSGSAVSIMTIHHSKGLEYPVVFVSCLGKNVTDNDEKATVIVSSQYGIGVDVYDPEHRIKYRSLRKDAMKVRMKTDFIGEELRLLYVAMTRAREKLILTGSLKGSAVAADRWREAAGIEGGLDYSYIMNAKSYLDLICPAALNSPDNFRFIFEGPDTLRAAARIESEGTREKQRGYEEAVFDTPDGQMLKRYAYGYPHRDISILPTKLSVSDLKRAACDEEEEAAEVIVPESTDVIREPESAGETATPAENVSGHSRLTPAEIGTLYHKVLRCLPIGLMDDVAVPDAEADKAAEKTAARRAYDFLDRLVKDEIITREERMALRRDVVARFMLSPLYRRMTKASKERILWREQPFVVGIPAKDISKRFEGYDELIAVQGVIDCLFEEDGGLVVVDYKTDRIEPGCIGVLADRYRIQLDLYASAAEKLTGIPVREKLIYSLALGETLRL